VESLVSALAASGAAVFLAAAFTSAVAVAAGRRDLHRVARGLGLAAAACLLPVVVRSPARPFVTFGVVAAIVAAQPLPLALAAGAAVLAALAPVTGPGSIAMMLAAGAAAVAAHTVARSTSAHLSSGGDAAWPASAAGAVAGGLVLAIDGGRALRWDYGLVSGAARIERPDAGLLLGLTLIASLAGTLLLAADALAAVEAPVSSPLARMLGRRSLLLAAGLSLLAMALVARGAAGDEGTLAANATDVAALVAAVGLLGASVPPLLAERRPGDVVEDEQSAAVLSRLVVVVALLAVLASGIEGWLRAGTYLTDTTQRLLSAALIATAAAETTRWRVMARVLAVGALVFAVVR